MITRKPKPKNKQKTTKNQKKTNKKNNKNKTKKTTKQTKKNNKKNKKQKKNKKFFLYKILILINIMNEFLILVILILICVSFSMSSSALLFLNLSDIQIFLANINLWPFDSDCIETGNRSYYCNHMCGVLNPNLKWAQSGNGKTCTGSYICKAGNGTCLIDDSEQFLISEKDKRFRIAQDNWHEEYCNENTKCDKNKSGEFAQICFENKCKLIEGLGQKVLDILPDEITDKMCENNAFSESCTSTTIEQGNENPTIKEKDIDNCELTIKSADSNGSCQSKSPANHICDYISQDETKCIKSQVCELDDITAKECINHNKCKWEKETCIVNDLPESLYNHMDYCLNTNKCPSGKNKNIYICNNKHRCQEVKFKDNMNSDNMNSDNMNNSSYY